jgi:hypothetical protein
MRGMRVFANHVDHGAADTIAPAAFFLLESTLFEVEASDAGTTAEAQARRLDWRIQAVGGQTILTVAVAVA